MRLIFAGTGGAFCKGYYPDAKGVMPADKFGLWQSNMLIESDLYPGKYLAIDCGGDVRHAWNQLGISPLDVEAMYISHKHADHQSDYHGLFSYFVGQRVMGKPRPKLYTVKGLAKEIWNECWQGGMKTVENTREANLTDFYEIVEVKCSKAFQWNGISMTPIRTVHVMSGTDLQPSYGLLIVTERGRKVFITTDTQFAPRQLEKFYKDSDVVFHDCETLPWEHRSGVHAHFEDLCRYTKEDAGFAAKTWFYHNGANPPHELAKKHGFNGFIETGRSFEL